MKEWVKTQETLKNEAKEREEQEKKDKKKALEQSKLD